MSGAFGFVHVRFPPSNCRTSSYQRQVQVFYKFRNVTEKVYDLLKQDFESREIANVLRLAFKALVKAFSKIVLLAPSFYFCRWSTAFNILCLFLEKPVSGSGLIAFCDKKVSFSITQSV